LSEQFKRDACESIHFTVPAIEQESEHFVGQIADRVLASVPIDFIQ
jgi:hypothetical protein